jgi:hypothetical protein
VDVENLAVERLRRAGFIVGRHACDAASDFDTIVRGLLRDLPASLLAVGDVASESGAEGCEIILPQRPLTPSDIAAIPARLACSKLVFVVDEFDRVEHQATRTRLADTIKLLSDRGERLHFMIVGVSTTLEQILGQHPSIERNITALHLPLLSEAEITEMLVRGGEAAGITFTLAACAKVAGVARGMPYMAQLMGLRIAQFCVLNGHAETSAEDVAAAIDRLVVDAPSEVAARYATLAAEPRDTDMATALYQVAAAPHDNWGRISLRPTPPAAHSVIATLIQQGVLVPSQGAPDMLQPADRRLMHHVLLLAARDGVPLPANVTKPRTTAPHAAGMAKLTS